MTFGERRKRADIQLILKDMDELESAFLTDALKLNEKRQTQILKRVEKALSELQTAQKKGDKEEVSGILASLQMPSQKEWSKLVRKLVVSSAESGVLRAHLELLRLKELYLFDDTWKVIDQGADYDVVFPPEALDFLNKYAYEIGVITDQTVINKIREQLKRGLQEGISNKELMDSIQATAGTWMSQRHAETIARTEIGKMYNAGRLARWTDPEQAGFVEALQYDAIVDTRTTELCRHLDGLIIAITNHAVVAEYTPPNHFNCRATWLPVTKFEEWKDNFDTSLKPEKGFVFKAPTNSSKLLKGKKKGAPLVQPKKKIDPKTVTDPTLIRSLPDEDFKVAISNIKDIPQKLSMVLERAESMAVAETGIGQVSKATDLKWGGWEKVSGKFMARFYLFGVQYSFFFDKSMEKDVNEASEMFKSLKTVEEAQAYLDEFMKRAKTKPDLLEFVVKLQTGLQRTNSSEVTWKGLKPVNRTEEGKKLLTIKTPPKTKNYREATGLQQAIVDGQSWMLKYVDEKAVPKTGITLKFEHDLRRAYAQGGAGTIHFGKYENDAGVVCHESGHVMHWNNKDIADLIHEFYMKRTADLSMGQYHGENTKKDHFYNPYVGRDYGWENRFAKLRANHGFMGQEVFSMGIQAMYSQPEKFWVDDKEHFLLTYAIMRGLF